MCDLRLMSDEELHESLISVELEKVIQESRLQSMDDDNENKPFLEGALDGLVDLSNRIEAEAISRGLISAEQ